jgi:LAO/AO transport system kinase
MVAARDPEELVVAAKEGDRAALARLLSTIERGGEPGRAVARLIWAGRQPEHVIGITGAPGAGKSTLTGALIARMRSDLPAIGVLAIDPSSPFSGGAILGDRIRLQDHALDRRVFVRSMATRGHLGGLASAAPDAIRALAACGYPTVLVETVGVGQIEVEIAGAADTTVVVVNPGWGDAVQAAKAGLLEIADVFAVNKADRPGAAKAKRELEAMLDMHLRPSRWRPPVVPTVATTAHGVDELWGSIRDHRRHLEDTDQLAGRRDKRLMDELESVLLSKLADRIGGMDKAAAQAALRSRQVDPYEAAEQLIEQLGPGAQGA